MGEEERTGAFNSIRMGLPRTVEEVESKILPAVKQDPCNSTEQEQSTTSTSDGCAAAIKKDIDDRLIDDLLESSDDFDDSDVEVFEPFSAMEESKEQEQLVREMRQSYAGTSDEDSLFEPNCTSTFDCDQMQMLCDVDPSGTEEGERVNSTWTLETGNNNKWRSSVKISTITKEMISSRSSQELELARDQMRELDDVMEGGTNNMERRDGDYMAEIIRQEGRIEVLLRVQGELEETIENLEEKHLEEKKAIRELKSLLKPMENKVLQLKARVEKKSLKLKEMRPISLKKENGDVEEQLKLSIQTLEDNLAWMVDKLEVERKNVELKGLEIEQKDVRNQELLDNLQKLKDCTDKELILNKVLNQQLELKGEEEFKIKEELARAKNKIIGLESDLLKTEVQEHEGKKAITVVQRLLHDAVEECKVKSKEVQDLHRKLLDERQKANKVLSNLIESNANLDIEQARIKEFQILIKQRNEDDKRINTKLDITGKEVESLKHKLEDRNIELDEKVERLTRFSLESIVKDSKMSELVKNREALENNSLRELADGVEALNRQLQEEKILEELNKKRREVDDLKVKLSNTQSRIEQLELKIRDVEESERELKREVQAKSKEVLVIKAKLQDQETEVKVMQNEKSKPVKRKIKEAIDEIRKSSRLDEEYPEVSQKDEAISSTQDPTTTTDLSTKEESYPAFSAPSSPVPRSPPSSAPPSPSSIPLPTAAYVPPSPAFYPPIISPNSPGLQFLAPPQTLPTSSLTLPPTQKTFFLSLRKLSNLVIQPQGQDKEDEERLLMTFGDANAIGEGLNQLDVEEATQMEKEEQVMKLLKHAVANNVKKSLQPYKQNLQVWGISSDKDFEDICRRLSHMAREEIQGKWVESCWPSEALVVTEKDISRIKEYTMFFFSIRKEVSKQLEKDFLPPGDALFLPELQTVAALLFSQVLETKRILDPLSKPAVTGDIREAIRGELQRSLQK